MENSPKYNSTKYLQERNKSLMSQLMNLLESQRSILLKQKETEKKLKEIENMNIIKNQNQSLQEVLLI